jgi:methylenetetrahydrofolate dehydrogenase (NADP+) / methenyltetrahydrofolate cyclohydrolase
MTSEAAVREAPSGTSPGESSRSTWARILDGVALAAKIREATRSTLDALRRGTDELPGVSVVLVGDDPASAVYANRILRNADGLGLRGTVVRLPGTSSTADVVTAIEHQGRDENVAGVIVQLPLPTHIDLLAVRSSIDPRKDIDGIHPQNAGLLALGYGTFFPSCAEAALRILRAYGVPLAGRPAVVIGRSNVVGKPAALLLLREHATVTVCHRQTRDLPAEVRRAEIVVVAAGAPGLVRGDMVQPGAVVIDCGINVVDGRIVGDVDDVSVRPIASAMTPVPGGVGPLTNAILMEHLARAVTRAVRGT